MSLISFQEVNKDLGGKKVLDEVTAEIHDGEHIGLIGRNGCGKTTLLRIITEELAPDSGKVFRKKGLRIGYLPQHPVIAEGQTTWEAALEPFAELRAIEREIESVEEAMGSADEAELESLVERQATLQERYGDAGGYTYQSRAEAALHGLGLQDEHFEQAVEKLSGGEKNRLGLAKLLLQEPDLLVLDEPTNYLDIHAVRWLEDFLRSYKSAILVVSHDRYFLDRTVTKVWEHRNSRIEVYKGNYQEYARQRDEREAAYKKAFEQQQREISRTKDFIRKNLAGVKTKQAQGRRKQLERMERMEAPDTSEADARIRFVHAERGGNEVLRVRGLEKSYGDRTLFTDFDLDLVRGDRVGIIGPNGTGKSTLLRILDERETPEKGEVKLGIGVDIGYYDQEHRDLDRTKNLFECIRELVPQWTDLEVRNLMAAFLFRDDEVFKEIKVASGGERARVALARIALRGSNFLVFDEPTNHLDLSSRRVLEQALMAYEGTLLVVSHDRYLLDRTVEKLVVFEGDGTVRMFLGNYSRYAESLKEREDAERRADEERRQQERDTGKKSTKAASASKPAKAKPTKKRKYSYEELEQKIMAAEERIEELHREMAGEDVYRDAERMKELKDELDRTQAELTVLEQEWTTWE